MSTIDDFAKLLDRDHEMEALVGSYDRKLSMNFSDAFLMNLSLELNYNSSVTHTVCLISGDAFPNFHKLPDEIKLTENKLVTEFTNDSEEVFEITLFLNDLTAYKKMLSIDYLVRMFWSIGTKNDLKVLDKSDPELPLLVIHYELSVGDLAENLYVSIAKRIS